MSLVVRPRRAEDRSDRPAGSSFRRCSPRSTPSSLASTPCIRRRAAEQGNSCRASAPPERVSLFGRRSISTRSCSNTSGVRDGYWTAEKGRTMEQRRDAVATEASTVPAVSPVLSFSPSRRATRSVHAEWEVGARATGSARGSAASTAGRRGFERQTRGKRAGWSGIRLRKGRAPAHSHANRAGGRGRARWPQRRAPRRSRPPIDAYGTEWALVSHTFSVQPTGEALISVLFERLDEGAR